MAEEIELKLQLNPGDIASLKRCRLLRRYATARARTRRLLSIYYDSLELTLLQADISLRIRRMSGRWYQSVKTAGQVQSGLHSRLEWEDCLSRGKPDFEKINRIDHPQTRLLANPRLQNLLRPIFSTDVKRTEWQLEVQNSTIELALDVGQLVLDGRLAAPICELELELKSGKIADIMLLARQLQERYALQEENTSKAELGYQHYKKRRIK